jgi:hypothetical protein
VAPLVAEASGLAMYATRDAASCVEAKRLISELGRMLTKTSFSPSSDDLLSDFARVSIK